MADDDSKVQVPKDPRKVGEKQALNVRRKLVNAGRAMDAKQWMQRWRRVNKPNQ